MAKKSKRAPRSGARQAKLEQPKKPVSAALKTTVLAAMAPTVVMGSQKKATSKTPAGNPSGGNRGFQGLVTGMSQAAMRLVPKRHGKKKVSPGKGPVQRRPQVGKAVGVRQAKVVRPAASRGRSKGRLFFMLIVMAAIGAGYMYMGQPFSGSSTSSEVSRTSSQKTLRKGPAKRIFQPKKVVSGKRAAPKRVVTSRGASLAVDSREFSKLSLKEKRRIWRKKSQKLQQNAKKKRRSAIRQVREDR